MSRYVISTLVYFLNSWTNFLQELLIRLQHHNSKVRQEAVKELKDIMFVHAQRIMGTQIGELLKGICALFIDKEREIRKDALKVLTVMLISMSSEQLEPFCNILLSYLRCAMTHIDTSIQEDSLLFLDVLIESCRFIDENHHSILLLDLFQMVSNLGISRKSEKQLITLMNSKNTSVQWRIQVYQRLTKVFKYSLGQHQTEESHRVTFRKIMQANNISHVPLYRNDESQSPSINLYNAKIQYSPKLEPFLLYQSQLMHLLFESWREVYPKRKRQNTIETILGNEGIDMLKIVSHFIQLFIEVYDGVVVDVNTSWIHEYSGIFLPMFPYTMKSSEVNPEMCISIHKCIELNLIISQIYFWIISHLNKVDDVDRKNCHNVIQYINGNPHILHYLIISINQVFFRYIR